MRVCAFLLGGFGVLLACASCVSPGKRVPESLADYEKYLQALPKSQMSSIDLARQAYEARFQDGSQRARDDAFLSFRKHYYVVLEAVNDDLYGGDLTSADYIAIRARLKRESFRALIGRNGIASLETAGCPYLGESEEFLLTSFGAHVSGPLRRFLEIRRDELGQQFQEDAGLMVPFKVVAERCITWERYLHRHEASPLEEEARHYYDLYLSTLLTGTQNSHVLDSDASDTDPSWVGEIQEAYDFLLAQHPHSRTAEILTPYYALAKASGFARTDEILKFLEEQGIEFMMATRCPTR